MLHWINIFSGHSHSGQQGHGHSHEILDGPGLFEKREKPILEKGKRDFKERAFTVGIGGPVGSGKTALMLALCRHFRETNKICSITNDIFTREDGKLISHS